MPWDERDALLLLHKASGQRDASGAEALFELAERANTYQCLDVKHASGKTYNGQAFPGEEKAFAPEDRLAAVFLTELGRDSRRRGEIVEAVPHVELEVPLEEMDPARVIELSADKNVDRAVFGSKRWALTVADLVALEAQTRIAVSARIPPRFYTALARFSTSAEYCELFSLLRSVALHRIATEEARHVEVSHHEIRLQRAERELEKLDAGDAWGKYIATCTAVNSARALAYLNGERTDPGGIGKPYPEAKADVSEFLRSVLCSWADFGFARREDAMSLLSLSLTELCTEVCVSQPGYYFVDGSGDTMNQIHPPTKDAVVFLSAPGLDFCTDATTRLEMPKYFEEVEGAQQTTDLSKRWKGFRQGGMPALRSRVKTLYRVILESAREQGVSNPSMLPMGLGVFLTHVDKADQDGVKEAYFRAQFELLSEEDWGFETYWLNPAQHRVFAETILREGVASGEYNVKCNVMLHNRDAKFLGVELAKDGKRPAVMNPSDCIAVMQGLIGYFWELGRGDRYVGEEDFAATSTGILARAGVSGVYTDTSRVFQVDTAGRQPPQESAGAELAEKRLFRADVTSCSDMLVALPKVTVWAAKTLTGLAGRAAGFSRMDLLAENGDRYNAGGFSKGSTFPVDLRPAAVFLRRLGRDFSPGATAAVVEGVPQVTLATPLSQLAGDATIVISAATVREAGRQNGPDPRVLFGSAEFTLRVAEVQALEKSTRVALGSVLPKQFYASLCELTTNSDHACFFSYLRSVPLAKLDDQAEWDSILRFETQKNAAHRKILDEFSSAIDATETGFLEDSPLGADLALGAAVEQTVGKGLDWYVSKVAIDNSSSQVEYFRNRDELAPLMKSLRAWLAFKNAVSKHPRRYGFASAEHLCETLSHALTELCTSVCVSQHGYYFVDGATSSGTMNTLHPPTRDTIVFLSAPGLDFCTDSTTRLEMPKYFEPVDCRTDDTPLDKQWKGFTDCGEANLRKRVKNLYTVIFSSARLQGARNPSMLPMGLGVFLTHVNKADQDGVKEAYFRAQYELLSEADWGFETYWLNPAQHRGLAERLLRDGVASGDYQFRCNVVLHNRDAKFLAVELAKEGLKPAVLNPSDCIAVMQGLIGYYWELGRGDRYVGEEDFAATSTGILGRHGLTDVYTDETRMVQVESRDSLRDASYGVDNRESEGVYAQKDEFSWYLAHGEPEIDEEVHASAKRAERGEATEVRNAQDPDAQKSVPPDKRLASVFLELLGRTGERGDEVEGIPSVALSHDVSTIKDETTFRIDHRAIDSLSVSTSPRAAQLYDDGAWVLAGKELKRTQASVRIVVSDQLPAAFYAALARETTSSEEGSVEFFWTHRSVPLARAALAEERPRLLAAERAKAGGPWGPAARAATRAAEFLQNERVCSAVALRWTETVRRMRYCPADYGFATRAQLELVLDSSLAELCTRVCVSVRGHCFVDGSGGSANTLHLATTAAIVFLVTPAPDFSSDGAASLEMPKYFKRTAAAHPEDSKVRWKGFLEDGEDELLLRVKASYRVALTAAREHGARNASIPDSGLGGALTGVHPTDVDAVRMAYLTAQFELLSEDDWGLETYWLNPGRHRALAERILLEGRRSGQFRMRCNVVLHDRDPKLLAVELAKLGLRPALACQGDCAAVMQGLIGGCWEVGHGESYGPAEDIVATSTAILARKGLTTAYVDSSRIVQVPPALVKARALDSAGSLTEPLTEDEEKTEFVDYDETFTSMTPENIFSAVECAAEFRSRPHRAEAREALAARILEYCAHRAPAVWQEHSARHNKSTLMHLACARGDLALARGFRRLACPFLPGPPGAAAQHGTNTPLHAAALHGHVDVIFWLVTAGHPLNLLSPSGLSVFDAARLNKGFPDCHLKTEEYAALCYKVLQATPSASELLEESPVWHDFDGESNREEAMGGKKGGRRVWKEDEFAERWSAQVLKGGKRWTDLHLAIILKGNSSIVDLVLRRAKQGDHVCKQMIDAPDKRGWTPLHWAILLDDTHAFHGLVNDSVIKSKLDAADGDGWTPLHLAVVLGRVSAVQALIAENAERAKLFHTCAQGPLEGSVWEDASDPSRYVVSIEKKAGSKPAAQKDHMHASDLGAWKLQVPQGASSPMFTRTFSARHKFRSSSETSVVLQIAVPAASFDDAGSRRPSAAQSHDFRMPSPKHAPRPGRLLSQNNFEALVSVSENREEVMWHGVYSARDGCITRRCRDWKSACTFPAGTGRDGPDAQLSRCLVCGGRNVLPHGLLPSLSAMQVTRFKQGSTCLHAACAAASIAAPARLSSHGVAWSSVGPPAEQIVELLLSSATGAALLNSRRHRAFLLALNRDGDTAFSIALRSLKKVGKNVLGLPLVRHLMGQVANDELEHRSPALRASKANDAGSSQQPSKQHADHTRWWLHSQAWTPPQQDHLEVCRQALLRSEQLISASLTVTSARTPVEGTYERQEYSGAYGWPEYIRKSGHGAKTRFILRCNGEGRWVIEQSTHSALHQQLTAGAPQAGSVVYRSEPHGGLLPQYVASWEKSVGPGLWEKQTAADKPFAFSVTESNVGIDGTAVVPLDYHRLGWLLTVAQRCDDDTVFTLQNMLGGSHRRNSTQHKPAARPSLTRDGLLAVGGASLERSWGYAVLSAVSRPGARGDGDVAVVNECIAIWRAGRRELTGDGPDLTAAELEDDHCCFTSALHCASVFGRRLPIRVLVRDYEAKVTPLHLQTAIRWGMWDEAAEILSHLPQTDRQPLGMFTTGEMLDGQVQYETLPTYQELKFCHEHNVAAPSVFVDLLNQHIALLKNMRVKAWKAAPHACKQAVRYLLSVSEIDYRDAFRTPESRSAFDGFDFGTSARSPELYFQLAGAVSGEEGGGGLKKTAGRMNPDVWFPSGFTVGDVRFLQADYPSLAYPLHALLLKAAHRGAAAGLRAPADAEVEFQKRCRIFGIECVKAINKSAERGEREDWQLLAGQVPEVSAAGGTAVVVSPPFGGAGGFFRPEGPGDGCHKADLHEWRMLPIELAIELGMVDVVEHMLDGGVVKANTEIEGTDTKGNRVRFTAYRDIWSPASAEFEEKEFDSDACTVNYRKAFGSASASLLHRALSKLGMRAKTPCVEWMGAARKALFPWESHTVPHFPHSGCTNGVSEDVEEDEANRRKVVELLLKSVRFREVFVKKTYAGDDKQITQADVAVPADYLKAASPHDAAGRAPAFVAFGSLFDRCGVFSVAETKWHLCAVAACSAAAAAAAAVLAAAVLSVPGAPAPPADEDRASRRGSHWTNPLEDTDYNNGLLSAAGLHNPSPASSVRSECNAPPAKAALQAQARLSDPLVASAPQHPPRLIPKEFGLSMLFQRAPWVVELHPNLLLKLIKHHPFSSLKALSAQMQETSSPIYIERRHCWARSFRMYQYIPQEPAFAFTPPSPVNADNRMPDCEADAQLTSASRGKDSKDSKGSAGTYFKEEPPGEQHQIFDDGLSLQHWLCLLRASGLLREALIELGDRVVWRETPTSPMSPTLLTHLGYSPLHYAAYSAAKECSAVLKERAHLDGGSEAIDAFVNHQVPCTCHPTVAWQVARDASIHHSGLRITTGDTPLMVACQFSHFDFTTQLLRSGARACLVNHEGVDGHDIAIALNFRFEKQRKQGACPSSDGPPGSAFYNFGDENLEEAALKRQVDQLNANPKMHAKLQAFARNRAIKSAISYTLFLLLLTLVTFEITQYQTTSYRDRFWARESMRDAIGKYHTAPAVDALGRLLPYEEDFFDISSTTDVQQWLNSSLTALLLVDAPKWKESVCFEGGMFGVYQTVGPARMSLLRVKDSQCAHEGLALHEKCPDFVDDGTLSDEARGGTAKRNARREKTCWWPYEESSVDSGRDRFKKWSKFPFEFKSARTRNVYDLGEGEVFDLFPGNASLLTQVLNNNFLDPRVRVASMFVTYYNPSLDLFVVVSLVVEVLPHGLALPTIRTQSILLEERFADWDLVRVAWFAAEIFLFSFLLVFIIEEVMDLHTSLRTVSSGLHNLAIDVREELESANSRMQYILDKEQTLEPHAAKLKEVLLGDSANAHFSNIRCNCSKCSRNIRPAAFSFGMLYTRTAWAAAEVVTTELLSHLLSDWNFLDILLIILLVFAATTRLRIYDLSVAILDSDVFSATDSMDGKFVGSMSSVAFNQDLVELAHASSQLHYILGPALLIAYIKVLKLVVIVPILGPVVGAIIRTIANLRVCMFLTLFVVVMWAFTCALHVAFGSENESYHSIPGSIFATLRIVLGEFPAEGGFEELLAAQHILGPLLFVFLLVFGQLIFLNILIAVVSEVYTRAIEVTNRDWSTEISLMYQYSLTRLADPSRQQIRSFLLLVRATNTIPWFHMTASDPRVKTTPVTITDPDADAPVAELPWVVVSASMQRAAADRQRVSRLSLADIDTNVTHETSKISTQLNRVELKLAQHQETLKNLSGKLAAIEPGNAKPVPSTDRKSHHKAALP
ncbi:Polycystin-2 [Diplonema papillatum]|nr:Polycystin-2 [Diplonema papillatum]